jgi:hypothetical protein
MHKLRILILLLGLACEKANCQSDSIQVNFSVDTSLNRRFFINVEISSSKTEAIKICDTIYYGSFICNGTCLMMGFEVLENDCFRPRVIECDPMTEIPIPKPPVLKDFTKNDTIHLRFDVTQHFEYSISSSTGKIKYGNNVYRFALIYNYYTLSNEKRVAYSDWLYVNVRNSSLIYYK